MEEITIYQFQLETIIEALRLTSNYNESSKGETCYDRQVRQAYKYAQNALAGKKDERVPYVGQRSVDTNAAGGDEKCTCPDDQCLLGDHPICRWKEYYERKSSEGHL